MTIGGKPATSDDWIDVRNPADLSTVVGRYPNGSAAHAAQPRLRPPPMRSRPGATPRPPNAVPCCCGRRRRHRTAHQRAGPDPDRRERQDPDGVVHRLRDGRDDPELLRTAPRMARADKVLDNDTRRLRVQKQPIGVVAAIIPWNFPVGLACGKIGPALMAGNTVVVKVPEFAPLATLEALGAVAAVFPPGVLNIVSGLGPEVGSALVKDPPRAQGRLRRQHRDRQGRHGRRRLASGQRHPRTRRQRRRADPRRRRPRRAGHQRASPTARSPTPARSASPSNGSTSTSRATTNSSSKLRAAVGQIVVGDGTPPRGDHGTAEQRTPVQQGHRTAGRRPSRPASTSSNWAPTPRAPTPQAATSYCPTWCSTRPTTPPSSPANRWAPSCPS